MHNDDSSPRSRRSVLRAVGGIGALALGASGGAGAAPNRSERGRERSSDRGSGRRRNGFGNGNGVGAFLNEPAAYRPSPVWSDGVVDATGQSRVTVTVGAPTDVDYPPMPDVAALPVAYAPQAVRVSPGTTVVWEWPAPAEGVPPIPHDVVSLDDGAFDSGMRGPGAPDFEHAFEEPGNYLYYCTPHGAPFPVHPHGAPPGETVYNEFGMRGAVLVGED